MPIHAVDHLPAPSPLAANTPAKESPVIASSPSPIQDTIAEAPPLPPVFTPSKPSMPLYRAIQNAEREYQVGNKLLQLNMNHLDSNYLELEECRLKMAEQIKENAEKSKMSDFWDLLKKIGTCVLAAISVVIGISLVSTGAGTLIGGAMIASGILAIANIALIETGAVDLFARQLAGDNEDLRKLYAVLIPGSIGLLSGILGVAGVVGAWSSINFVTQALSIAQTAASFADGFLTLGRGVTKGELKWSEAKRYAIQKTIVLNEHDTDQTLRGMENFMEQRNQTMKRARHCLESFVQSMNKALQI